MATSSVSSLFGECDGLLGFATLQKALDAAFHPDKLRQISFRSLRMKLGSQRSPRAVFPGNFELRPIDLRSDGSEGHLAGINVWEFGVGQFLVALHGRKERVPLRGRSPRREADCSGPPAALSQRLLAYRKTQSLWKERPQTCRVRKRLDNAGDRRVKIRRISERAGPSSRFISAS